MLEAFGSGWQLGLTFNPLYSLVGAVAAAMLLARSPSRVRWVLATLALGGAWLLGDGLAVIAHVRGLSAQAAGLALADWVEVAVWVLVGLGLGYALPAWAGVFVGRRVTWGTGWASAGVVAAMVSGMISRLVAVL